MAKQQNLNLNFDEGYKEYTINNDPNRVIRVNTSDLNIFERFDTAIARIQEKVQEFSKLNIKPDGSAEDTEAISAAAELADFINGEIDYIFNADIHETVFGNQSCLSFIKGVPLYEVFINCILPVIKKDLEEEEKAAKKRVADYAKKAARFKNSR